MDPMKKLISSFMLDINNYLSFVTDYGKPNYKYFNYVLNRMGIMHLFLSKNKIFTHGNNAIRFVSGVFVALKNRFLSEENKPNEETNLKRAAIIYLISKIYFTDSIGNLLKLRIIHDEWIVFVSYINTIKHQPDYLPIKIMFYHLFTENFFKFTIKNKVLALDFGTDDKQRGVQHDPNDDLLFWRGISKEINILERNDVAALKELETLRDEAMKPIIGMLLPESSFLREALEEFESLKEVVLQPTAAASGKIIRKQTSEACKRLLNTSRPDSDMVYLSELEEEHESDSKSETETKKKKARKSRPRGRPKLAKKWKQAGTSKEMTKQSDTSSSESENEKEFKRMVRSLGYNSQNVMKGIGAQTFSEKLKKCYEKTE